MWRCFILLAVQLLIFTSVTEGRVQLSDKIYLEASFRPRFEFDNRDFNQETGFDAYGTMRTRIGLGFENLVENTTLYMMIGDSRMMGYTNPYLTGKTPGPIGYDNNLGVNKVYLEVRDIWKPGTAFKIGRMSNDQGRSYIFGPGNWNYFGPRTYDGIKIGYTKGSIDCHLWSFYSSNGDRHWYPLADDPSKAPNSEVEYKRDHTLNGLDLSFGSKMVNFLFFQELDQDMVVDTMYYEDNIALNRFTGAVNLLWKSMNKMHRIDFDFGYQIGKKAHNGGNGDISAYMIAGDYHLYPEFINTIWIGLGFEIFSGNDGADPNNISYFFDNYSSKHKTFGFMDYFKSPTGIKSRGLHDYIFRLGAVPVKDLTCQVDLHSFRVDKAFISTKDGKPAHGLGFEIDSQFMYTMRKGLLGELGIDFFMPNEDWKDDPGYVSTFIYFTLTAII